MVHSTPVRIFCYTRPIWYKGDNGKTTVVRGVVKDNRGVSVKWVTK